MRTMTPIVASLVCIFPLAANAQLKFSDGSIQSTAGQPKYNRTVVVRPVGTDAQNGSALKTAYDAASGTTPILIKIEPGVYDLGTSHIDLRSGFNIEGSGVGSTTIRCSQSSSTIGVLNHAQSGAVELRLFTLDLATTGDGIGINLASSSAARISDVAVRVTSTPTGITGIRQDTGVIDLKDCSVDLTSAPGIGVRVQGTSAQLRGITVLGAAATGQQDGIVRDNNCVLDLRDSSVQLTSTTANFFIRALLVNGGANSVFVSNCELLVSCSSPGIVGAIVGTGTSTVQVRNARLVALNPGGAGAYSVAANTGAIRVGSSQVIGTNFGVFTLVHCYDGNFAAIP